jgi:hypothetical protein
LTQNPESMVIHMFFRPVNDQNLQFAADAAFEGFRDSLCNRTSENLSVTEYRLSNFGLSVHISTACTLD